MCRNIQPPETSEFRVHSAEPPRTNPRAVVRRGVQLLRGKEWPVYAVLALCCLAGSACAPQPEVLILGRWQEAEWDYEKLDKPTKEGLLSRANVASTTQDLIRHESEFWEFLPGYTLNIRKTNGDETSATWRLKGRGHVLAIQHDSGQVEIYDIKELTEHVLILNFDIGLEVRGIARLTFQRQSHHNAEGD